MAISNAPSQVATSALQAIPFSSMIGGPLKACIEAQAMAAKTTWDFIQEVGLNQNPETGEKTAVNVAFSFNQNGRMVQLNVPLLTIVPIPYIAIHSIDINLHISPWPNPPSEAPSLRNIPKTVCPPLSIPAASLSSYPASCICSRTQPYAPAVPGIFSHDR